MQDIAKIIFISEDTSRKEADAFGAIKKMVDKRFTLRDKEIVLKNKGVQGVELERELKNFKQELVLPAHKTELAVKKHESFVIESKHIALSYTNGKGHEDPHWHPDEVETYLIHDEIRVALRYIDRPMKHKILTFKAGRIFFPPRLCHFTDLRGFTEVMSFREKEQMQRVNCKTCYLLESKECKGLIVTEEGLDGDENLIKLYKERSKRI